MEKTNDIWKLLNIRYVKLHFHLRILEDTILPINKVSALRGGMGEMLLRSNCIRERECENCDFESECIVRRTMYSQLDIKPDFMQKNDSVGYVIECENYEKYFYAGDELVFNLILIGKNIVYFNQYLQAFTYLGMEGLGKYKSKYAIEAVTNTKRKIIVEGNNVYKRRFIVQTLEEYVKYRLEANQNEDTIVFHTPAAIKFRGQMIEQIDMEAVLEAIARRIYIFDCFEGIVADKIDIKGHVPGILSQEVHKGSINRYSSTHEEKIKLCGIYGNAIIEKPDKLALILLYAGELMHIGKNTSFGFGRYSLSINRYEEE
jgi:hypothetical protein